MTTWAGILQRRANLDEVVKRTRNSLHMRRPDGQVLALCTGTGGPPLHLRHPKTGLWVPAEQAQPGLLDRFLEWVNRPLVDRLAQPMAAMADFNGQQAGGNFYLGAYSADYATARSTFNSASSGPFLIGQQWRAFPYDWYQIERGVQCFDTSSIPADAFVTQVNQTLTATWDDSNTDFDVQIVKANWTPTNTTTLRFYVSASDANYDLIDSADRDDAIWRNTFGMSINTPYTSGNLSTAWVVKEGVTRYGYQNSREHAAIQPPTTGNIKEQIELGNPINATPSYRPTLSVLYELGQTNVNIPETVAVADALGINGRLPDLADTISGVDTVSVAGNQPESDRFWFIDAVQVENTVPTTADTIQATDSVLVAGGLSQEDAITATDTILAASDLTPGDIVTAVESVVVSVAPPPEGDAITLVDDIRVTVGISLADAVALADAVRVENQNHTITPSTRTRRMIARKSTGLGMVH